MKVAPAQHLAVRLAAKEAAYKALSGNELARGIGWRDVEVFSRSDGRPGASPARASGKRVSRSWRDGDSRVVDPQRDDGDRRRNRRALMGLRGLPYTRAGNPDIFPRQ